jgi:drug/metabolite transporter (DMT)-like permease
MSDILNKQLHTTSPLVANSLATGREKILGHLAMMLFVTLIAGSFTLGSMAVPHISSGAINTVRFFLATIILGVLVLTVTGKLRIPVAIWRFVVLGLLMGGYFVLMFKALKTASPVSTGAVFTLIPLMSAGFGFVILKQTTRPIVLLALLVAGAGAIWVIFRGDVRALMDFDLGKGEMIFLAGCILHAIYAPLVKKFNRGESNLVFTFWTLLACAFWIVLYGIGDVVEANWTTMPVIVWVTIGYLAVFTTAGTFFLVQFASMRLPVSKVFSYAYLTPSVIIVLEGLAGHGWVGISIATGSMITILGLIIMALAPDQ